MGTDREREVTTLWSDVIVAPPGEPMTGVTFTRGGYHRIGRNVTAGLGGYTLHRADHWLFEGTGLGYGDVLGADATVVGYECDGCAFTYRDGLPYPTGEDGTPESFEILGTCPTRHFTHATVAAAAEGGGAERAGVPRRARLRDPRSRGGRADPARPRRARRLHERRRCDRGHVGVHRLGPRPRRPRDRRSSRSPATCSIASPSPTDRCRLEVVRGALEASRARRRAGLAHLVASGADEHAGDDGGGGEQQRAHLERGRVAVDGGRAGGGRRARVAREVARGGGRGDGVEERRAESAADLLGRVDERARDTGVALLDADERGARRAARTTAPCPRSRGARGRARRRGRSCRRRGP